MISRRGLLTGLAASIAAPSIVVGGIARPGLWAKPLVVKNLKLSWWQWDAALGCWERFEKQVTPNEDGVYRYLPIDADLFYGAQIEVGQKW